MTMRDDDFNPLVPLMALGMGWMMLAALPSALIARAVLGPSQRRPKGPPPQSADITCPALHALKRERLGLRQLPPSVLDGDFLLARPLRPILKVVK